MHVQLLLPPPREHKCLHCGITSYFRVDDGAAEETGQVFFVEHNMPVDDHSIPFELCDLCDQESRERHQRRTPEILTFRGVPDWSGDPGFFGFEEMPLICVTDASGEDWETGRQEERETWLFCRDRFEWKHAWEAARLVVRYGFNRFQVGEHGSRLLARLPAYKAPWAATLTVHTGVLPECDGGPFMGFCWSCESYDLLLEKPSLERAFCEGCFPTDASVRKGGE